MRQREFKASLKILGLTQLAAAERLCVPGGKARVSEWERGTRAVPPYIAAHVITLLALMETAASLAACHRERDSEGAQ